MDNRFKKMGEKCPSRNATPNHSIIRTFKTSTSAGAAGATLSDAVVSPALVGQVLNRNTRLRDCSSSQIMHTLFPLELLRLLDSPKHTERTGSQPMPMHSFSHSSTVPPYTRDSVYGDHLFYMYQLKCFKKLRSCTRS